MREFSLPHNEPMDLARWYSRLVPNGTFILILRLSIPIHAVGKWLEYVVALVCDLTCKSLENVASCGEASEVGESDAAGK